MRVILVYYINIPVLLLLVAFQISDAQSSDGHFTLGVQYLYAGISDEIGVSSGAGLELFKEISPGFSIGLKSVLFFPLSHELSGFNMSGNYDTKILAISALGRFDMIRTGMSTTYILTGINYHLTMHRGEMQIFNDVPPFGTTFRTIDTNKYSGSLLAGGGFEISGRMNFYVEPLIVFTPSVNLVLSTGVRIPI